MTVKQSDLKSYISGKFGNLGRFCLLTGRDLIETHNLLKKKESAELDALEELARRTRNRKTSKEVTARERNLLRRAAASSGTDLSAFCRDQGLDYMTVRRILKGGAIIFRSPLVSEVLKKLEITA